MGALAHEAREVNPEAVARGAEGYGQVDCYVGGLLVDLASMWGVGAVLVATPALAARWRQRRMSAVPPVERVRAPMQDAEATRKSPLGYWDWDGCIGRLGYLARFGGYVVVLAVLTVIAPLVITSMLWLMLLGVLLLTAMLLAPMIQRLNDLAWRRWIAAVGYVPFVSLVIHVLFLVSCGAVASEAKWTIRRRRRRRQPMAPRASARQSRRASAHRPRRLDARPRTISLHWLWMKLKAERAIAQCGRARWWPGRGTRPRRAPLTLNCA